LFRIEKEGNEANEIITALESSGISVVDLNAAKCPRVIFHRIKKKLSFALDFVSLHLIFISIKSLTIYYTLLFSNTTRLQRVDIFNRGRELAVEQASEMIRLGIKDQSKFGYGSMMYWA
jgi:hypothetical protein